MLIRPNAHAQYRYLLGRCPDSYAWIRKYITYLKKESMLHPEGKATGERKRRETRSADMKLYLPGRCTMERFIPFAPTIW